MRIIAAIAVASALFVVGGGCSRPWQASTADVAPLELSALWANAILKFVRSALTEPGG